METKQWHIPAFRYHAGKAEGLHVRVTAVLVLWRSSCTCHVRKHFCSEMVLAQIMDLEGNEIKMALLALFAKLKEINEAGLRNRKVCSLKQAHFLRAR